MAARHRFRGTKRFLGKLDKLRATAAPTLTIALQQGGDMIVAEQKALVPVKTGKLRDSIQWTSGEAIKHAAFQGSKVARANDIVVRVSAGNSRVRYAHLVEYGTQPHDQPKRGVRHPGATPKPFFIPGYEAVKRPVRKLITTAIRAAMKRAMQ